MIEWIVLEEIEVSSPFKISLLANKSGVRISTKTRELDIDLSYASIQSTQVNSDVEDADLNNLVFVYFRLDRQQHTLQGLMSAEPATISPETFDKQIDDVLHK